MAKKILDKKEIKYEYIDANKSIDLVNEYGVKQAPTLIVIKNNVIDKIVNVSNIKKYLND